MSKIKFSDGTELVNLTVNGNCFVTAENIGEDFFKGKLSKIIISADSEEEQGMAPFFGECSNLVLGGMYKANNEVHFALRERTYQELKDENLQAQIDYLSMMSDIEM